MLFTPEQRNPPKIRQSSDAFPVFILRGYKNTTPFWSMSLCFFVTFLNLDSHSITLTQILVCVVTVTHPAGALLGCDLQTKTWHTGKLKLQRKTSANLIIHGVRAPPLDSNSTSICAVLRNHVMTLLGFVFVFMKLDLVWFASVGTQTKRLLSNLSAR